MANATSVENPTTTRRRMQEPARSRRFLRRPTLRFTPYAWAKLVFLRDLGSTEVGGFGISAKDDLLLIEDVRLVRQRCSSVTVQFDDVAVTDFFDEQVDRGLPPERFARVWIHTHPGNSASPDRAHQRQRRWTAQSLPRLCHREHPRVLPALSRTQRPFQRAA